MEAHEIAEQIHESAEPPKHHAEPTHEMFRKITAIYVGVVAMLLAIATLGGADATKEMLNANIHASDVYAYYQSKYARQVSYQLSAEQLELFSAGSPNLPPEQQTRLTQLVQRYRDTAKRYESEPSTGDGKKELLARATKWEEKRDHAAAQSPNFEYAEALFQIAIVLGSVAIVAASPWLIGLSGILSFAGILLTINGYFVLVQFPQV